MLPSCSWTPPSQDDGYVICVHCQHSLSKCCTIAALKLGGFDMCWIAVGLFLASQNGFLEKWLRYGWLGPPSAYFYCVHGRSMRFYWNMAQCSRPAGISNGNIEQWSGPAGVSNGNTEHYSQPVEPLHGRTVSVHRSPLEVRTRISWADRPCTQTAFWSAEFGRARTFMCTQIAFWSAYGHFVAREERPCTQIAFWSAEEHLCTQIAFWSVEFGRVRCAMPGEVRNLAVSGVSCQGVPTGTPLDTVWVPTEPCRLGAWVSV